MLSLRFMPGPLSREDTPAALRGRRCAQQDVGASSGCRRTGGSPQQRQRRGVWKTCRWHVFSLRPQRLRREEGSCWERLSAAEQAAHCTSGSGNEWYCLSTGPLAATPIRRPRTQRGFQRALPLARSFSIFSYANKKIWPPEGTNTERRLTL